MITKTVMIIGAFLPIVVILLAVYLMLRYFSKQNEKQFDFLKANQDLTRLKLESERSKDREKILIPLRLQALERLVLLLERINPPNLLTREMQAGIDVGLLQSNILQSIRNEYEHNMSQQLYVSKETWEKLKTAKEKVVQVVNTSAAKFKSGDDAIKLANEILTTGFDANNDPIENAMSAIKDEIKTSF